jgi:hypothetical protein
MVITAFDLRAALIESIIRISRPDPYPFWDQLKQTAGKIIRNGKIEPSAKSAERGYAGYQ